MPVWIGINYTQVSGDDDAAVTDDEVGRFLSYENVNDLLILEDMYFGFDIDSNYSAIKISGGLTQSFAGGTDNLEISAIVGITRTVEDVFFAAAVGGPDDDLGNEFDVRARWTVTRQLVLQAAFGLLVGSDVLEKSMKSAGPGGVNDDADDRATLWSVGMDLKF